MMLSDWEIAREHKAEPIRKAIEKNKILDESCLQSYDKPYDKVNDKFMETIKNRSNGKLILVTSINPTPAGEGKTTTAIGLADALNKCGKNAVLALREPSLGPVFGMKGGATGGGYAQVVPITDINLHFTGDIHAITSAHNLLSAMIDNHIYKCPYVEDIRDMINITSITWKRVIDMNDRALRHIITGLGNVTNESGFEITAASEVMAILCLSKDIHDLKTRLGNIVIGRYEDTDYPVAARRLYADGAMTALLANAIYPNVTQTLNGTLAFIHGGPFANIAHGCNSIIATDCALKCGDYVVTEAGFGADLGAEKFLDIQCRAGAETADRVPDVVVIVVTLRALKMHGGVDKTNFDKVNGDAIEKGFLNLAKHITAMKAYGLPVVVGINYFPTDTDEEIRLLQELCEQMQVKAVVSNVHQQGANGGINLAMEVIETADTPKDFRYIYDICDSAKDKISKIATNSYGASDVVYTKKAEKNLRWIENHGYGQLPICIAKTQYSLSDDPSMLGRPTNFVLHINDFKLAAGAGFIIAYAGNIMTMPGLPLHPAAEHIDIDSSGQIIGLS